MEENTTKRTNMYFQILPKTISWGHSSIWLKVAYTIITHIQAMVELIVKPEYPTSQNQKLQDHTTNGKKASISRLPLKVYKISKTHNLHASQTKSSMHNS